MDKAGYKMKKIIFGAILLALVLLFPISAMATVDVGISISLPPLIISSGPLEVVVIPETDVYAAPDVDVDIFFYNGWWWRPWQGHWYRSHHYDSGWTHYQRVPSFYRRVPSGWRNNYRDHRWAGHRWNHQRIPHEQVQRNWSNWEKNRHWEKQNTWGVQGLKPHNRPQQHARPQSGNVRSQHSQPQQQDKAQHGKPEKGQKNKQNKEYDN